MKHNNNRLRDGRLFIYVVGDFFSPSYLFKHRRFKYINIESRYVKHQKSELIEEQPAYWSGVFAMTLCVFTLIASEFMPVSLLTPITADLNVSEGMVGQGIAISGAFAVVTSLSISHLARSMNRKTLLLLLTAMMAVSGVIIALAHSYMVYMMGRALIGIVIGGFGQCQQRRPCA
nr:hypothetical protein [Psychrobacter sp. PraFG1]UNK06054.1 hypothetical protein MN210_05010 [Psychrobacter sp. PraFG1]